MDRVMSYYGMAIAVVLVGLFAVWYWNEREGDDV